MKKSLVKSALVGGIIIFVFNLASWNLFPLGRSLRFQDPVAVAKVIRENAPVDGLYVIRPQELSGESTGLPYFYGVVHREGDQSSVFKMLISLIGQTMTAGLISWVILRAKERNTRKIVIFTTLTGLIIAIGGDFRYFNWAGFPIAFVGFCAFNHIGGWFLAGIGMSRVLKK